MTLRFILLVFENYQWSEYVFGEQTSVSTQKSFAQFCLVFAHKKSCKLLSMSQNIEIVWNPQVLCIKNVSEISPFQELFAHISRSVVSKDFSFAYQTLLTFIFFAKLSSPHAKSSNGCSLHPNYLPTYCVTEIQRFSSFQYFCSQKANTGFLVSKQ